MYKIIHDLIVSICICLISTGLYIAHCTLQASLLAYSQKMLAVLPLGSFKSNTGQQNLTFFLSHEEKYLILIVLLTLNSNM
jgi:hypothetical protein